MPRKAKIDPDKCHRKWKHPSDNFGSKRYLPPSWEPTEEQERIAVELAGYGLPRKQIAVLFQVDVDTLEKHLGEKMDIGSAKVNSLYLRTAFKIIMGEPATYDAAGNELTPARPGSESMLKFYLARKLGWVEPKEATPVTEEDMSGLSDDAIRAELHALSNRARAASKTRGLEAPVSE